MIIRLQETIGRVISAAIFIIAAIYTKAGAGYEAGVGDPLGPKAFPLILSIPTMLLSLSLIISPGKVAPFAARPGLIKQMIFIIALFGFVFLLERIGYVPGTVILVAIIAMLMQARPVYAFIVGLVVAPVLWFAFDKLLDLPLPFWGSWIP